MVKLSSHDPPSPKLHSIKRAINLSYILNIGLLCCLCSFFYILGAWQSSSPSSSSSSSLSISSSSSLSPASSTFIAMSTSNSNDCIDANKQSSSTSTSTSGLDFEAHHHHSPLEGEGDAEGGKNKVNTMMMRAWPACDLKYSEYTPCEDTENSLRYERERLVYRERHCPKEEEEEEGMDMALSMLCLVPAPPGYRNPPPWPKSRDMAWFGNVPHRELTIEKAVQNWVQYDGTTHTFHFPGGGTMFPNGAKSYIDDIHALIRPSLSDGSIRTALDTGCGVASWGAYLLDRNILTMSFAPRDTHEAQVQFALERGVPAMLGVMASKRLPYPARAFDMAHCSRCLIPWKDYDGVYLIEVDRVLRPGGYWILSGPPINWETHWKGWQRTKEDLTEEQEAIESLARSLCWKKVIQKGNLAIWQKPWNHIDCIKTRRVFKTPAMCKSDAGRDGDTAWYTKMETCITPLPDATDRKEVAGGALSKWPARLSAIPPRILSGTLPGISSSTFTDDMEMWRKRVDYYKSSLVPTLGINGRYRNIMDMNAGFGGFAATLEKDRDNMWVMNVVPTIAKHNTLGVIYERGLIGTYQDWCEAFSTYPRTYDFIHADTIFGMYQDKCNIARILLEMDRILRPEGAVIVRDDVDVLNKVAQIASGMRWEVRLADHESGPFNPQKILIAVKTYWVGSVSNSTQSG